MSRTQDSYLSKDESLSMKAIIKHMIHPIVHQNNNIHEDPRFD